MRADKVILGLASILIVSASSVSAQQPGRVVYVSRSDTTCDGRSPCYGTIQAAVNVALPSDTIRIQAGTYNEQVTIQKNDFPNASENDRIIIEADPGVAPGSVLLTGSPGPQCTDKYAIRLKQSKFVTIRGLTITGTGGQAIALMGGNNGNLGIHIELNRIFGNGSSSCNGGITVARGNPDTLIVNNLIYANGRNAISFIDSDGGPHYVINNTINDNEWNGVDVGRNHTITLANNIINNNGSAPGTTGGRFGIRREGSTSPQPAGIKLLNNLVCGNTQGQISAQVLDSTDSSNYTPVGNEGTGVGALPGCELPVNLFGNVNGPDNQPNTADDDFSLKPNSLAIDVGMDPRTLGFNPSYNPIFEADFVIEGSRPADGNADKIAAFDAGAFEFVPSNQAPIANAGTDRTVLSGTLVIFDGTASFDPDGNPITYQWLQTAGPTVTLSSPSSVNPAFTAPQVQTPTVLVFQLTVSDGFATSAAASVRITVEKPNSAPVLSPIGNKTVSVGATLTFTVNATDPDNDPLTYSVSPVPLPGNTGFDTATRVFTFIPAANQVGSFNLTFAVSDSKGGVASETITITVTSGLAINITSPGNGATVPPGALIVTGTVQASGGEIGVTVNGFAAGVQGNNFTALIFVTSDTTSLTATVLSRSGAAATHTIALAVSDTGPSPIALHASPTSGSAPLTVTVSLFGDAQITQIALDADGDGTFDFSGSQLTQQSFIFSQPGTYVATAIAADAQGIQLAANAVVQVFDPAQLDAILQARWAAMKDALRAGNIPAALSQIHSQARSRYEEGFQIISAQLPSIDDILTPVSLVRIGDNEAVYRALRTDDGTSMTFEIRFALDVDGLWRVASF